MRVSNMGACLPKSPACGEVRPNTKLFNVCCGGQVIIEHSEVDGAYGDGETERDVTLGRRSSRQRREQQQQTSESASTLAVL